PLLALVLRPFAVAGVGEKIIPRISEALADVRIRFRGEDRADLPGFHRDERFDLALALDDKANGDALDAPGAQPLGDLAPQQRGTLIAHDAIEASPRLLRVNPILIDRHRVLECFLDLGLGDGIKDDTLGLLVRD